MRHGILLLLLLELSGCTVLAEKPASPPGITIETVDSHRAEIGTVALEPGITALQVHGTLFMKHRYRKLIFDDVRIELVGPDDQIIHTDRVPLKRIGTMRSARFDVLLEIDPDRVKAVRITHCLRQGC